MRKRTAPSTHATSHIGAGRAHSPTTNSGSRFAFTKARSSAVGPGTTADDLAFVKANRLPLFVIGEWARPAPMWEVAWVDGAVRFRTIGEVGEIGPWRD